LSTSRRHSTDHPTAPARHQGQTARTSALSSFPPIPSFPTSATPVPLGKCRHWQALVVVCSCLSTSSSGTTPSLSLRFTKHALRHPDLSRMRSSTHRFPCAPPCAPFNNHHTGRHAGGAEEPQYRCPGVNYGDGEEHTYIHTCTFMTVVCLDHFKSERIDANPCFSCCNGTHEAKRTHTHAGTHALHARTARTRV
jgi:hypothetical protein